jgi:cellulose biosynthesis protein BcsQ
MKVIAFASVKGGVGKSAVAILITRAFAAQEARFALIDSDPSKSETDYFLREAALRRLSSAIFTWRLPENKNSAIG